MKILHAARTLFASHGVGNVSIDAIAARAGVGKGTVFRRFGSKAGLASALLNDRDRELQAAILSGPPPLGPSAPPRERILAFFDAYLELLENNVELVFMSETSSPGARYQIGSYVFWRHHLTVLLVEFDPTLDARCTAHALLSLVSADLHLALRADDIDRDRARRVILQLLARALPA